MMPASIINRVGKYIHFNFVSSSCSVGRLIRYMKLILCFIFFLGVWCDQCFAICVNIDPYQTMLSHIGTEGTTYFEPLEPFVVTKNRVTIVG